MQGVGALRGRSIHVMHNYLPLLHGYSVFTVLKGARNPGHSKNNSAMEGAEFPACLTILCDTR